MDSLGHFQNECAKESGDTLSLSQDGIYTREHFRKFNLLHPELNETIYEPGHFTWRQQEY